MVYAQTGRLYDSAKQYRRAAHYYKLHVMANSGSAYLPGEHGEVAALICLAGAYDWDSVETGGSQYKSGCCKDASSRAAAKAQDYTGMLSCACHLWPDICYTGIFRPLDCVFCKACINCIFQGSLSTIRQH